MVYNELIRTVKFNANPYLEILFNFLNANLQIIVICITSVMRPRLMESSYPIDLACVGPIYWKSEEQVYGLAQYHYYKNVGKLK